MPAVEGHRQRLRERFLRSGLEGFHDHEVLEFLLSYAIPRRDVKPLAKALLEEFHSLSGVLDAPYERIQRVKGIGSRAAVLVTLVPCLAKRYLGDRWKNQPRFTCAKDAVSFLSAALGLETVELFCVMALNSQNGLIALERVQEGTVDRTAVYPRQVVEVALKHRAAAVIFAHNHPSGRVEPSEADRRLTRKLCRIFRDLNITVHDHIIVAGRKYYSFAEAGELP